MNSKVSRTQRINAPLMLILLLSLVPTFAAFTQTLSYPIVDTGLVTAYSDRGPIGQPTSGQPFFGQDANFPRHPAAYRDNQDGTVSDLVTGLIWQKDMGSRMTLEEARIRLSSLNAGLIKDWRIPTIKELFSLALYNGQVFGDRSVRLFIDTRYFMQPIGDSSRGEREIDAQTWSETQYRGLTMGRDSSRFGMNFVDGRIKAYPLLSPRNGEANRLYFRFVRGNPEYGKNRFVDNHDGTVSDLATGLMWAKADSQVAMDWRSAIQYATQLILAGYDDWRLPSIKELQSIVDYSRSLQTDGSAAIDPVFTTTIIKDPAGARNYGYFWSATTLLDGPEPGDQAAYVAFGNATARPFGTILDAHGAGAVRSDPKSNSRSQAGTFFGPQGDFLSILNFVRAVRTIQP